MQKDFYKKLENLINCEGIDNDLNIPDYIIADFISDILNSVMKMNNRISFHKNEGVKKWAI